MKIVTLKAICVLSIIFTTPCGFAHEKDEKNQKGKSDAVKEITTPEKPSGRRKKVEMCADCGKPETECECDEETKAKEAERNQKSEKK